MEAGIAKAAAQKAYQNILREKHLPIDIAEIEKMSRVELRREIKKLKQIFKP